MGRKRSLQASCLELLFSLFIQLRDFLHEGFCHRVLLAAVTLETNEREQTIGFAVLGFAVGEAGKPTESSPVRRARAGIEASG